MKASRAAQAVSELLAIDAKPTEAAILAAILAADKKGKDGLGPEKIEKLDEDMPGKDSNDDPEDTNGPNGKAKDKKAKDKMEDCGEDEDDDYVDGMDDVQPKETATRSKNDGNAGPEPAKDKKGMDAAIASALAARDALHDARRAVEPVLGVVAYDSAAQVYRAALAKLGVDAAGIHESALAAMFTLARDAADARTPQLAADAATVRSMAGAIKGYDRLR